MNDLVVAGSHPAVRVNMLACLEALLNLFTNSLQAGLMLTGLFLLFAAILIYKKSGRKIVPDIVFKTFCALGSGIFALGFLVPVFMLWSITIYRDFFSF